MHTRSCSQHTHKHTRVPPRGHAGPAPAPTAASSTAAPGVAAQRAPPRARRRASSSRMSGASGARKVRAAPESGCESDSCRPAPAHAAQAARGDSRTSSGADGVGVQPLARLRGTGGGARLGGMQGLALEHGVCGARRHLSHSRVRGCRGACAEVARHDRAAVLPRGPVRPLEALSTAGGWAR